MEPPIEHQLNEKTAILRAIALLSLAIRPIKAEYVQGSKAALTSIDFFFA
jgi:hypothetical protein